MKMIVAVDKNWAIGKNGELLISIPEDMQFFRQMTLGAVVVMGRRTLESFPHQRPLKNRINIVLTCDPNYEKEGAIIVHNMDELAEELKKYNTNDVFCIGGESVYRQMEPLCDVAYVTKLDYAYDADAHFPNLDESGDWEMVRTSDEHTYYDIVYYFTTYARRKQ